MKCFALLTLLVAVLMSGCGAREADAPDQALIVGFAQLGSESGWRVGNTEDIKAAAGRAGMQLLFRNADQKQENQIRAIRSFIALQVDVIAFSPIVETGWDNVLREAREAGIPVLLTDRSIQTEDEDLFAGFIGSDFTEEGRSAGRFLLKKMEGRDQIRIVEISGTINSTPAMQRAQGFREVIAGRPEYRIVRTETGDFLRSKGKECMRNILSASQGIDVLFSHNDAMTLGAIEAIEEEGLIPGKDVVIVTVDGEQGAVDLLKEGKINCVVECTPLIGDEIMELAKKLASGKAIERFTYPEESVFTEYDDGLDALPPRGY